MNMFGSVGSGVIDDVFLMYDLVIRLIELDF